MTAGSADLPPVLVLGLGNPLLTDDGLGLKLLELVSAELAVVEGVEFVDGGTQGLALLGYLTGRKRVIILDAVGLGHAPGTFHALRGAEIQQLQVHRAAGAHDGNALELLAVARLLGDAPDDIVIVGIEPDQVRTGFGLTGAVTAALPGAMERAMAEILTPY